MPLISLKDLRDHQVDKAHFEDIVRQGSLLHRAFGQETATKPQPVAVTSKPSDDDLPLYFQSLNRKTKKKPLKIDDDDVPLAEIKRVQ